MIRSPWLNESAFGSRREVFVMENVISLWWIGGSNFDSLTHDSEEFESIYMETYHSSLISKTCEQYE